MMNADRLYTLAVVLRSANVRHFRLMLRSVVGQSLLPAEVLFVGLPSSGSAVAQLAARHPLPLEVEQTLTWCAVPDADERGVNWRVLETIAERGHCRHVILTESNVVLHADFAHAMLGAATAESVATAFAAVLSPHLSSSLDEAAIAAGEPFRSWWRVVLDGTVGRTRYSLRIAPMGKWWQQGTAFCRGGELSSSALAFDRATLEQLLAARKECENSSTRALLRCAHVVRRDATYRARHVRLTDERSHVFALAPVAAPQWSGASLGVLDVRPVLHRHRMN
ncbi:MAG: hypothetical protein N3B17_04265 [Chlorobi bacterium]|nr:hypothetical protein [Chlorobiota bacterium]